MNLADVPQSNDRTLDMRKITSGLIVMSGQIGDDFLQYLYGLALSHLELKAGLVKETPSNVSQDPEIRKLVDDLKTLAHTKRCTTAAFCLIAYYIWRVR